MHPTIAGQIMTARIADMHRHAEQATIARAAGRSARARRDLTWRAIIGHLTSSPAHRTLDHRLRPASQQPAEMP